MRLARVTRARLGVLALASLALGCRDGSEPTANGERVELSSEVVPRVCRGTVEYLDAELARVEAELALPRASEPTEVHIVAPERIAEFCEPGIQTCITQPQRRLYMTPHVFVSSGRYELVRDRLARTSIGSSKPVLFEGLTGALTRPSCAPPDDWQPPLVTTILLANTRTELGNEGRYLGGELVRWLLDTRGVAELFALMAEAKRRDTSSQVRVAYLERFGTSLDSDLFAHWRPDDAPVDPGRAGCVGIEPAVGQVGSRLRLEAEFDCDSPRVRNDFEDPSRVFVEWILNVPEAKGGTWTLVGPLSEGVTLTLNECNCVPEPWSNPWAFDPDPESEWLEDGMGWIDPGRYRLRAFAPPGTKLDIEVQLPCDFDEQDCLAGQQCTVHRDCLDTVEDPAPLGEPCSPALLEYEAPLPCDVGLTCLGPVEGVGVCVPACTPDCPDDLSCASGFGCTPTCDPLAPNCGEGHMCVPSPETGVGHCIPGPANLGTLEQCDWLDFSCAPGLECQSIPELEGCHDPESWFDFGGCCVPICDPSADAPGCPAELPNCIVAEDDYVLGTCQP